MILKSDGSRLNVSEVENFANKEDVARRSQTSMGGFMSMDQQRQYRDGEHYRDGFVQVSLLGKVGLKEDTNSATGSLSQQTRNLPTSENIGMPSPAGLTAKNLLIRDINVEQASDDGDSQSNEKNIRSDKKETDHYQVKNNTSLSNLSQRISGELSNVKSNANAYTGHSK